MDTLKTYKARVCFLPIAACREGAAMGRKRSSTAGRYRPKAVSRSVYGKGSSNLDMRPEA